MASYKVTYFNITALGEPIRMLLSYGGIPFEDERIEREQWPTLKSNQPFGQLPILLNKSNGKVAHQSLAICRYLAKQVKLVGNDDWENLEIDAAADTFNDLRMKIGQYAYEQDEAIKEAKKKPLFAETIPYYLERIDKAVQANNGYMAVGRVGVMRVRERAQDTAVAVPRVCCSGDGAAAEMCAVAVAGEKSPRLRRWLS